MKKQLLLLAVALFAIATAVRAQEAVRINSTNFPDSKFRDIVKGKDIDKNQDGWLETGELAAVTTLTARSKEIESLKGVEHFFKLMALHCENNRLSSLDVSKITTLKGLYCSENRLTSLDVSKNTALTILYCSENRLTSLDVSKNTALTILYCYENKLTSLDLTNNKALTNLSCYINQIGHSDMLKLVNSLPTVAKGYFHGISISSSKEKNVLPKSCVEIAQGKGWNVQARDGSSNVDYAGSEDPGIIINATNFPDENFRAVVAGTKIDKDADGYLSDEEIAAVTKLYVYSKNIASLKGIEFFTALTYLNCNNNQLTSLDVSKNSALTELYCDNNQLTSLDVSKNTALLYLECHDNKLTSLDVSKNTALLYLYCYYNQLTSLDVSKNTALQYLICYDNKLTSLDVSKNTALTSLGCNNNQIKGDKMQALVNSLPTVTNGTFWVIYTKDSDEQNVCTKPQVKIATDKGWKVYAYIDEDWEEYAGSDPGIAINATNFPDENFRTIVAGTDIDKDADGYLSDEEIAAVTKLIATQKNITSLKGIEFFTALTELYCANNQLTTLDVSNNTKLESLSCGNNQLTSLDVSNNTKLELLSCDNNQLTSLDVNKNTALQFLLCANNQLTSLDVSKNTALEILYCYEDQLTSLDVSNNTKLESLSCDNNQLTSLDVSKNTALIKLYCENNELTSLDVSKNTALTELDCSSNQLKSLDVSKNTALEDLYCYGNQLTSLDVSKNTALTFLACFNNQIKEDQMLKLVNSLPTVTNGKFYVINTKNRYEQNVCTEPQVKIATDKGWTVNDYNGGGSPQEYAGSDPGIAIDATNFPDENFRSVVAGTDIDKDADGYLSAKEIAAVTKLDVSNQDIESLKGVEIFNALEKLYCDRNKLTDLDVSKNTKLTELSCWGNRLTNLDVSKNTKLTELYCDNNQLTDLDVSKNTKLTKLHCYGNQIKGVQMQALVNSLPKVTGGEFYVIDTKNGNEQNKCTEPQVKIAKGKGWTVYDWNGGNKQKYAGSDPGIAINATNFPDKNFRSVIATATYDADADGYLSTEEIDAATTINVENKNIADLKGIEHFTALTSLNCGANQLSSLDVTKNTKLTELSCENNQLTSLDVSNNTELTNLDCYDNELTSLDVSTNSQLITLDCKGNELTALDVVNNTELTWLDCSHNQLTALDVTTNTELKGLACFSNQIKGKQMQALVNSLPMVTNGTFYVVDTNDGSEKNVITEPQVNIAKGKGWTVYDYNGGSRQEYAGSDPGIAIDATNFPDENFRSVIATTTYDADADGYLSTEEIDAVTTIDAENKNIADLKGIEHFTALTTLRCGVNQLMGLDVSKNTALTALYCYGNQIQGEQMQALVNSLPTVTDGEFYVVDTNDGSEKNVITEPQVKIAKGKGWTVYDWNGGSRQEYAASVESAIGGTEVSAEEKDHWYSLDGKRLSGKPTKKGIYVRNGRKVVVK